MTIMETGPMSYSSEGQEKYVRELSVTPMEYFTGAIENFAWRK
jgi:hypothetical protein